jgi:hypothetical protein
MNGVETTVCYPFCAHFEFQESSYSEQKWSYIILSDPLPKEKHMEEESFMKTVGINNIILVYTQMSTNLCSLKVVMGK